MLGIVGIFATFSVIPGAQPICLHRPTWPLSGGRTLDASLRPGGGV